MKIKVMFLGVCVFLFSGSVLSAISEYTHVLPMSCQPYSTSANKIDNRLNYLIHKYQAVGWASVACQVQIPFNYEVGDTALVKIKEFGILHQDPDGLGSGHNVSAFLYAQNHNSWAAYLKAHVSSSNTNSSAMVWTKMYPDNVISSILDPLYMVVQMKRSAGNQYPTFRHARVVVEYIPSFNVMALNAKNAIPYPEDAAQIAEEIEFPEYRADLESSSMKPMPGQNLKEYDFNSLKLQSTK